MNESINNAMEMLRKTPLKATNQRLNLLKIIFKDGNAHYTAEDILKRVKKESLNISLATIYNTLNSFKEFGLLLAIKTSSDKIFFDTNVSHHHHFYCKDTDELIDINSSKIVISKLPQIPTGKKVSSINVVVNIDSK
ncbi:MAG: transcriptional repressor [Rickettsiales bacterium]|nr:transcriptional repressor [Rickettsiales bacterium]